MKIDAPKMYDGGGLGWYRVVRESDWRKIMAVLKAAEAWWDAPDRAGLPETEVLGEKLMVLALHLRNKS